MNKNIKLSVIALGAMLLTPALVKSNEKVALAEETEVQYVAEDRDGTKFTSVQEAIDDGMGRITLLSDVTISSPIVTKNYHAYTFDFNGHVITCSSDFKEYAGVTAAFYMNGTPFDSVAFIDSSTDGTGGITCLKGSNAFCYHINYRNADVVFESGTYKGQQSVIYVEEGQATIKGGTFSNTPVSTSEGNTFFLNCYDDNFKNDKAKIYVKGGTFIDYDPSTQAADAGSYIPDGTVVSKVVESGVTKYVAKTLPVKMGDKYYESLQDAVNEAKNGETITLQKDAATNGVIKGNGVQAKSGSNFILDLNGLTYEVTKGMVGSTGSETNGFHLLRDSNITIKNGTLTKSINYINGSMLIQNYSNLTLDNVVLQGTSNIKYVLSNNYGNIVLKNYTTINAIGNNVAFDVCYFNKNAYAEGVTLTIADTTVTVNGRVEYTSSYNTESSFDNLHLIIPAGYELTLSDGLTLVASEDGKTQEVTATYIINAKEFAALWKNARNSEGGLCAIVGTSAMDDLLTKYDELSSKSKTYLESVQDADGVTVAYSVNYFKTLQQTKSSNTNNGATIKTTLLNANSESNNVAMIVLFAMLGIAGVASYYYIEKRKVNN